MTLKSKKVEIPTPYKLNSGKCLLANQKPANQKISKISNFACSNPARGRNLLRFALSLTISKISANLKFLNF